VDVEVWNHLERERERERDDYVKHQPKLSFRFLEKRGGYWGLEGYWGPIFKPTFGANGGG